MMNKDQQQVLKGETIMKCNNPFCVRVMKYSPKLIVADASNSIVTLYDLTNHSVRETFTVTTGSIKGVGVDPSDDSFYIVTGKLLVKYDSEGVYLGKYGKNLDLKSPIGVAVDEVGNCYITDLDGRIVVMSSEGLLVRTIEMEKPYDIYFEPKFKYMVVSDQKKDVIRLLTKSGEKVKKLGYKGNAKGQFSSPSGVFVDSFGHIFVADLGNHRIQMFDETGKFMAVIGGSRGKNDDEMEFPRSVCVDPWGVMYVADSSIVQ
ncbi:hypothetical protein C9374_005513 [Naegleria lovaniensis]|uniref:NHL repeat-containing protein n=1 Tax=Naegleria lovaniensis TaxID=51637 RepID=A0AA88KN90_NAELO|nr:uncharacterized protein C9374_005513 [Naegleria lovaniensis]KAG2382311.1 hypothetical protein C9374_005513 [Naegleria lovaniensis]